MEQNLKKSATRLSKSPLWELQHAFFQNQGINAWVNHVPHYVTSNPFVAASYAHTTVRFIQDCLRQESEIKNDEPFYIVEIGAGHGKFSFYFLKTFCALCEKLGLSNAPVVYIMNDYTTSALSFWENQEELRPYLDSGILDFALFDFCKDETIHLQRRNVSIHPGIITRPMTYIANYAFDSVPSDIFRVKEGKLQDGLVEFDKSDPNDPSANVQTHFKQATLPYYKNPVFDELLEWFADEINEQVFMFPTGPLQAFQNMERLSNGKFMLISLDKGYLHPWQLPNLEMTKLANHGGGTSIMVNFSILGEYCRRRQGMYFSLHTGTGIKQAHFIMGFEEASLPETLFQIEQASNGINPRDFYNMHQFLSNNSSDLSLQTIFSYLRTSHWDPHVFKKCFNHFYETIEGAKTVVKRTFLEILPKIAANIYTMPDKSNPVFEIGVAYHLLYQYKIAIEYYKKALKKEASATFASYCNMGLCYTALEDYQSAQSYFELAEQEYPKTDYVEKWLSRLNISSEISVYTAKVKAIHEPPVLIDSDIV